MKVLVTGGAGFIGTNVVRALIEQGHEPAVLDDLSTGLKTNIPEGVPFFEGSITSIESIRKALLGAEAVVHLAARGSVPRSIRNPVLTQQVNVDGTLNVLEVAREKDLQVVFSSSSSVYGANTALPKNEEMILRPLTPYAASKLAGEALMMAYGKTYDLCITTLRFFNVFGPWQRPDHVYSAVIPKWIWKAMNNQKLEIFGDGQQSRDFTSVTFVKEVILDSLKNRVDHPEPINLAFGNKITLNQVIIEMKKHFPKLEAEYSEPRLGDVYASQNDPTLLKSIFPKVRTESFEESLSKTIHWLAEESSRIIGGPQVDD